VFTSHREVPAILRPSVPHQKAAELKEIRHKTITKKRSLDLTHEELAVLLPLASDQLFRNEFIDVRFPGFERNRENVQSAKAVISRLKERLYKAQQGSGDTLRLSLPSVA
jgi:hypothetical protein